MPPSAYMKKKKFFKVFHNEILCKMEKYWFWRVRVRNNFLVYEFNVVYI